MPNMDFSHFFSVDDQTKQQEKEAEPQNDLEIWIT